MDGRHTHFSEVDKATLAQFKQAKEGEWQKERQQTRQQLRPAVWIAVLFLAVLFCGLASILAVSGKAAASNLDTKWLIPEGVTILSPTE